MKNWNKLVFLIFVDPFTLPISGSPASLLDVWLQCICFVFFMCMTEHILSKFGNTRKIDTFGRFNSPTPFLTPYVFV